jgi:hypothetical protein
LKVLVQAECDVHSESEGTNTTEWRRGREGSIQRTALSDQGRFRKINDSRRGAGW